MGRDTSRSTPTLDISEPFLHDHESSQDSTLPEWKDQITLRGLFVSGLLGTLFCIITHKLNLTVGIIPSLNVAAGLLGFFFVKSWTTFLHKFGFSVRPFTRQENTVIQTCVVACYGLAFSGGFGSYLLSMDERTYNLIGADYPDNRAEDVKNPGLLWMIGLIFVVSFLGLFNLFRFIRLWSWIILLWWTKLSGVLFRFIKKTIFGSRYSVINLHDPCST